LSLLAPLTFPDPLAPLAAARRIGTTVDVEVLDAAVRSAERECDVLLVEGAGGLLVPITEHLSFDSLFARWSLDLVVVAVNRLGVINHVRLTCAAARRAGSTVRAIVLNHLTPDHADVSVADNARLIEELEDVRVIELPWMNDPGDLHVVATLCERSGLADIVAPDAARVTTSF
jgi:dethiobiotin synthetase